MKKNLLNTWLARTVPGWLALLLGLHLLAGCGFHLRQPLKLPENLSPVYVVNQNAPFMTRDVRWALLDQKVALTPKRKKAKLLVFLRDEQREQRVLSVSALSGKQEEIELVHRVELELRKADGEVILPPKRLSLSRDFLFSETEVLAKSTEEKVLNEELQKDLVADILRRIEAALKR